MGWNPGDRVGGNIRLLSPLRPGGRTWRATQAGGTVAVTFAAAEVDGLTSEARARFIEAAKIHQTLDHPQLVPPLGFGLAERMPYVVAPFIPGESLAQRLRRERVLPIDQMTAIVGAVASALDHLHGADVIHGDLRAENICLRTPPDGVNGGADEETTSLVVVGLERARRRDGAENHGAEDLVALADIAYRGLLGRPRYEDATNETAHYPAPSALSPFLPAEVDAFFARAFDQTEPFADATALAAAFAASLGATRHVDHLRAEDRHGDDDTEAAPATRPSPERNATGMGEPRHRWLDRMLYLFVGVAALLAGAALARIDGFTLAP
ncbi:MAG: protein kinase [Myxococcota bacterium]